MTIKEPRYDEVFRDGLESMNDSEGQPDWLEGEWTKDAAAGPWRTDEPPLKTMLLVQYHGSDYGYQTAYYHNDKQRRRDEVEAVRWARINL